MNALSNCSRRFVRQVAATILLLVGFGAAAHGNNVLQQNVTDAAAPTPNGSSYAQYTERVITYSRAFDLLAASNGQLYYIDHFGGELGTLNVGTGQKTPLVTGLRAPYHMAESQDRLYFTEFGTSGAQYRDGALSVFDPRTGAHTRLREDLHAPASIEADSDGDLYVIEVPGTSTSFGGINRLLKFPRAGGEFEVLIDQMNFVNPLSLLLDEQHDRLFIGDGGIYSPSDLGSLLMYSLASGTLETILTGLPTVWDLEFDGRGNILVAGFGRPVRPPPLPVGGPGNVLAVEYRDAGSSLRAVSYIPRTLDQVIPLRTGLYAWTVAADGAGSIYFATGATGDSIRMLLVPEPGAIWLATIGLVVLVAIRRVVPRRTRRVLQMAATLLPLVAFAGAARADIYQWEYLNPADPSQGKRQSTTLAPEGAGIDAVPGADLANRNLTMAYLIGADLTYAYGPNANLTNADLSWANLAEANFGFLRFCAEVCYFAPAATLTGANLSYANLSNSRFNRAALADSDLTAADARGAFLDLQYQSDVNTTNLILPEGRINGLDLHTGELLVVRDYDGNPVAYPEPTGPIAITIDQHLTMNLGGTLRMVFEADAWDSTISFAAGIPVTLGGTLELTFAADVNPATQFGRTFDLFDWTGVSPTGEFTVDTPYHWDMSALYTTGEVTLLAVPEPTGILYLAASALSFLVLRRERRLPKMSLVLTGKCCLKLVALGLGITLLQSSSQAAGLRTVALSGTPAPGTPVGVTYSGFGSYFVNPASRLTFRGPVINDAGRTAFRANLTGSGIDSTNNQGIWSEGTGSLALVARTGSAAPGAPGGMNFGLNPALELFTPVMNGASQTAFYGGLTDGSVGVWSEGSGGLAPIAIAGMQVPGEPAGVNHSFEVLRDVFADLPKLNDAGQTSFWGNLTGNGIDNTNDWGVWSDASGSLAMVARSGSPAPGTPAGVKFDSYLRQTGFNDLGQSAFFAFVTGAGVDPSNDHSIWSEGSGGLALVARSGSPAPGTPSGVTFDGFFWPVAFNNASKTAFSAALTGNGVDDTNEEGLWSEGSGTLSLVARRGSQAPGTPSGVNFDYFSSSPWPVLNDAGQVAFRCDLNGSGVTASNSRGIWLGVGADDLSLVARTGDLAPGTTSGVRFSDLYLPALNSAGQTAFRAILTGSGVSSSNNLGIWATDQNGVLQLIVRTGTQLEVEPGVFRTISDLAFVENTGNSDGRASGFNNLGQLVFWTRFTNGTQGVFVSSVVARLPGDFNDDGTVDAADYVVWRKNDASQAGYDEWRANFGRTLFTGSGATIHLVPGESPGAKYAVPEPVNAALAAIGLAALILRRRRVARAAVDASSLAGRRQAMAITLAVVAVLWSAPVHAAHGAAIELAAGTTSSEFALDSEGSFEAHSAYVSGRIQTNVKGPIHGGTNINTLVGADAFYTQGYTGTNSVIANIECGHIWSSHETLAHVLQLPNHPSALNEFDRHATWVGAILGGRQGGANPGAYQQGLAPNAQLYSGATATQWNGQRYAFDFSDTNATTFDQYRRAFETGVNDAGRTADVINRSAGAGESTNGSGTIAIGFDGFASANPRTLFVACAGNDGPGPDRVWSPAAGYNGLSVAALGPNPPYDRPAWFSSGGPNDYADPVNGTKNNARQVVDIAAPGENLSAAYYGGETGGNGTTDNPAVSGPGPTGLPSGSLGGSDYYARGALAGTSLAAPTVAGGAALLYDAAYSVFADNADARDARVMKAVLMNSADKTFGWNNGQVSHPNGNGGVLTTQGLDNRVGTGRMNLTTAFDQFLTGTTDVVGTAGGNLGVINEIGWDFGQVASGTTNDYFFNAPLDAGSTFTATLTWFRDRRINTSNTVFEDSFDDLNLELWSVDGGIPTSLVSESSSLYNESEHFSFALPVTGNYALRVRWFKEVFDVVGDANHELYGLAWRTGAGLATVAIPEPVSAILLTMAAIVFVADRRAFPRPKRQLSTGFGRSLLDARSPAPLASHQCRPPIQPCRSRWAVFGAA